MKTVLGQGVTCQSNKALVREHKTENVREHSIVSVVASDTAEICEDFSYVSGKRFGIPYTCPAIEDANVGRNVGEKQTF
jgi:hypothetical protein